MLQFQATLKCAPRKQPIPSQNDFEDDFNFPTDILFHWRVVLFPGGSPPSIFVVGPQVPHGTEDALQLWAQSVCWMQKGGWDVSKGE